MARRVLAGHLRGERRRSINAAMPPDVPATPAPAASGPLENTAAAQAFRDLPDRDQALLTLVAGEGLGIAEIATALDRSRDAVSIRPHRAR